MASIRAAAQNVLSEARDGIGWIALWKEGRGWETAAFWPELDKRDILTFEDYDIPEILEILEKDPNAIIVNSYIHNLGPMEEATRKTLADGLRWQYELQHSRLADYMEDGTSYVVVTSSGEYVGKAPIREQAVGAAKAKAEGGEPVDVIQTIIKAGAARIRRCRYLKGGAVRKIWEEARA